MFCERRQQRFRFLRRHQIVMENESSRSFLSSYYYSQLHVCVKQRHHLAIRKLSCGQIFNRIHHRTNWAAKVSQLSIRQSLLEAKIADGLTERLSIFRTRKDVKVAKVDQHRRRTMKKVIFISQC